MIRPQPSGRRLWPASTARGTWQVRPLRPAGTVPLRGLNPGSASSPALDRCERGASQGTADRLPRPPALTSTTSVAKEPLEYTGGSPTTTTICSGTKLPARYRGTFRTTAIPTPVLGVPGGATVEQTRQPTTHDRTSADPGGAVSDASCPESSRRWPTPPRDLVSRLASSTPPSASWPHRTNVLRPLEHLKVLRTAAGHPRRTRTPPRHLKRVFRSDDQLIDATASRRRTDRRLDDVLARLDDEPTITHPQRGTAP